eukprot:4772922-Amphidinium_carterae.2
MLKPASGFVRGRSCGLFSLLDPFDPASATACTCSAFCSFALIRCISYISACICSAVIGYHVPVQKPTKSTMLCYHAHLVSKFGLLGLTLTTFSGLESHVL